MLSDTDLQVLRFAARAPRSIGAREDAVRSELGMTPTRYYQRLNILLDSPEALALEPQLIRRLQRLRDGGVTGPEPQG